MSNLVNGRSFIAIRRKAMKIWDSKLANFYEKRKKLAKFDFLYFYEFATHSYETSHIHRIRHNKSSGEAYILFE